MLSPALLLLVIYVFVTSNNVTPPAYLLKFQKAPCADCHILSPVIAPFIAPIQSETNIFTTLLNKRPRKPLVRVFLQESLSSQIPTFKSAYSLVVVCTTGFVSTYSLEHEDKRQMTITKIEKYFFIWSCFTYSSYRVLLVKMVRDCSKIQNHLGFLINVEIEFKHSLNYIFSCRCKDTISFYNIW